jgi:polyhydroxybutyrate depolymerase
MVASATMQLRPLFGSFLILSIAALGCGSDPAATTTSGTTTDGTGGTATEGTGGGGAGGTGGATGGAGGTTTGTGGDPVIGGDRPVKMYIPSGYDGTKAAPLVVLLHGYGATGAVQEGYFKLKPVADERGFIYAVPDGTVDATGKQFWNATDACCGFGAAVDDSAYLSGVIDEIEKAYKVDAKRVYVVGHSNGGFMSYRMACDHADQIAAIVSLAGATFNDDSKCKPTEPVSVAQIHGTADTTIQYGGGVTIANLMYPGAVKTVETWAAHDGCEGQPSDGGTLDIEGAIAGQETKVSVYGTGCMAGGHAELWTVEGGGHIPSLSGDFAPNVFDFLEAHPKP